MIKIRNSTFVVFWAMVAFYPSPVSAAQSQSQQISTQCVFDKAIAYSKKPELAEILAALIASECAELLPQTSKEDCGEAQARCDAVVEDTNAQLRRVMERYAYKAIVMSRQSGRQ